MFMHYGVFIYFASDRLNSRDESFRIVHLVKGYGDERYSKDLGKKIHRGQEGKIRKGFTSGASCYGQRTSQQYIGISTPLAGIMLNPAHNLAA
jgi:hypothetical protein